MKIIPKSNRSSNFVYHRRQIWWKREVNLLALPKLSVLAIYWQNQNRNVSSIKVTRTIFTQKHMGLCCKVKESGNHSNSLDFWVIDRYKLLKYIVQKASKYFPACQKNLSQNFSALYTYLKNSEVWALLFISLFWIW